MKSGGDGKVRTCRSEVHFGRIFYESAEINAVIAKCGIAIAVGGRKFYLLRYVEAVRMSRTPAEIRSTRIGALARLPAFFALENKRAVVAGGSPAATWKAELLSAAGARVEVFAAAPGEEMLALAAAPPRGASRPASIERGRRTISPAPPSPLPIAPTTKKPRNSPRPRAPRACRSMSSTVRRFAISPSAPSSIARRWSSAFRPMARRRCSARRSAPRSKR